MLVSIVSLSNSLCWNRTSVQGLVGVNSVQRMTISSSVLLVRYTSTVNMHFHRQHALPEYAQSVGFVLFDDTRSQLR